MTEPKKKNSSSSKSSTLEAKSTTGAKNSSSNVSQESVQLRTRRKKASTKGRNPDLSSQGVTNGDLQSVIATRAYEIYEERIRLGAPTQDWLRAEQEILARVNGKE